MKLNAIILASILCISMANAEMFRIHGKSGLDRETIVVAKNTQTMLSNVTLSNSQGVYEIYIEGLEGDLLIVEAENSKAILTLEKNPTELDIKRSTAPLTGLITYAGFEEYASPNILLGGGVAVLVGILAGVFLLKAGDIREMANKLPKKSPKKRKGRK